MEFERDEFDNEVNTNMENNTNNSASNDEPKDIDSIIRRHSESLAKAAEDIARNDGSSDTSYDAVQNDVDLNKEAVSSFASNASENLENTQNINISDIKEANNATNSGNFGENNRGTQSENVRTQTFAAQPQKGKGKGKERKKSKVGKAFGLVASAAVFGLVAGGVMVGVNNVASSYVGTNTKTKADDITIGSQDNAKSESTAAPATNLSSMDVSTIVDKAMPSVVSIYGKEEVTQNSFFGPQSYEAQSSGSGIIVGKTDSELLIVTNNHVIADTTSLEVEFSDGKKASASVKGGDSDNDVAVVAVKLSDMGEDTLSRISIANIGDSDNVKVGQGVVAIGNALGYGQSVTVGYISALNREVKTEGGTSRNLLQTDAAINPGNSGGALLNMKGELIGINVAKYADTNVEGMGYSIPSSAAESILSSLSTLTTRDKVPEAEQGVLGVQVKDIDAQTAESFAMPKGIYIFKVLENTGADNSRIQERDIITKLDGQGV